MTDIINERFLMDRECKHSVRYKPAMANSKARGMTIYLTRAAIGPKPIPNIIIVVIK